MSSALETEHVGEFFGAEIGGYSVLEITGVAIGIALAIGAGRWAYRKMLGDA